MKILASKLEIPLKVTFKQASFTRKYAEATWVEVEHNGFVGYGEGTPRKYVTGETIESALSWIDKHKKHICQRCRSLEDLKRFVIDFEQEIDVNPAAWCAVELALLDCFAKQKNESVEQLLNISEKQQTFFYTAVLGEDELAVFKEKLSRFLGMGFKHYKIKISGNLQQDQQRIDACYSADLLKEHTLRVDANNLWQADIDCAHEYFKNLNGQLIGIEEPFQNHRFDLMEQLYQTTNTPLILDESCTRIADIKKMAKAPKQYVANLKVAKVGGILRGLKMVEEAINSNMNIIIGAHVGETSLLTRAAMLLARKAQPNLIGHEGGFGEFLIARDVVEPVLQLGKKGIINLASIKLKSAGWGLQKRS